MRKLVIILALVGAALAAAGQALPSGSVLFGQNTWLAPDGSVWTGKDGYGYKRLNLETLESVTDQGNTTGDNALFVTGFQNGFGQNGLGITFSPGTGGNIMSYVSGENVAALHLYNGLTGLSHRVSASVLNTIYVREESASESGVVFSSDGILQTPNLRASGADAVNAQDFVTLSQLQDIVSSSAPKTYYVFEGEVDNQHDTTLLEIPLQYEDYWDGSVDDEGWGIDFEIKGNFANTSIDNELNLWVGTSPSNQSNVFKIIIPSGTIPAQYFWLTGTIVKQGPSRVHVDTELKTGDIAGVDLHVISENVGVGSGWSLETGAPVRLEVSTNFASPGSVFVHSARFTQRPINGIYINNL